MNKPAHFSVDPRVATILGENYSSSERALRELIDNVFEKSVRVRREGPNGFRPIDRAQGRQRAKLSRSPAG